MYIHDQYVCKKADASDFSLYVYSIQVIWPPYIGSVSHSFSGYARSKKIIWQKSKEEMVGRKQYYFIHIILHSFEINFIAVFNSENYSR